jgi:hypothetical protein
MLSPFTVSWWKLAMFSALVLYLTERSKQYGSLMKFCGNISAKMIHDPVQTEQSMRTKEDTRIFNIHSKF